MSTIKKIQIYLSILIFYLAHFTVGSQQVLVAFMKLKKTQAITDNKDDDGYKGSGVGRDGRVRSEGTVKSKGQRFRALMEIFRSKLPSTVASSHMKLLHT